MAAGRKRYVRIGPVWVGAGRTVSIDVSAAVPAGAVAAVMTVTGVELTTGTPNFGHFNVYPWPTGALVPQTHGTTPRALFDAVHALPGSFEPSLSRRWAASAR